MRLPAKINRSACSLCMRNDGPKKFTCFVPVRIVLSFEGAVGIETPGTFLYDIDVATGWIGEVQTGEMKRGSRNWAGTR